jgi:hypothetical protein
VPGFFFGIITLLFWDYYVAFLGLLLYLEILVWDCYVAFLGLLLYLDSCLGLLRCFFGIVTVPGFLFGIVTDTSSLLSEINELKFINL